MSDLTVSMPAFSGAEVLSATPEAMCRVRLGSLSVQFVVIDNAGTDDTLAVLPNFAARLPLMQRREPKPGKSNAVNGAIASSAHHVSDREGLHPARLEPFGPNFWERRSALAGVEFRADLGPHPSRRTLGDEGELLRQLRRRGFIPIYSPSSRVAHCIEPERTTEITFSEDLEALRWAAREAMRSKPEKIDTRARLSRPSAAGPGGC